MTERLPREWDDETDPEDLDDPAIPETDESFLEPDDADEFPLDPGGDDWGGTVPAPPD